MRENSLKEKIKTLHTIKLKEVYINYKQELFDIMENQEIEDLFGKYSAFVTVNEETRKIYLARLNDYLYETEKLEKLKESDAYSETVYLNGNYNAAPLVIQKEIEETENKIKAAKEVMDKLEAQHPNLKHGICAIGKYSATLKYAYGLKLKINIIRHELARRQLPTKRKNKDI